MTKVFEIDIGGLVGRLVYVEIDIPDNAMASLNVCNSGSGSLSADGVGAITILGV